MKKRICVELSEDVIELLAILGPKHVGRISHGKVTTMHRATPEERVQSVLESLAYAALDGMRRPGSWERGWVTQAFGSDFEAELEHDPECEWHMRVKKTQGGAP